MDQQNVIVLGCLTFAVAITAFILWGPSPRPRKRKGSYYVLPGGALGFIIFSSVN